ncbi:hypothetical protein RI367_000793 [Sorochytrium milnesiophthora]
MPSDNNSSEQEPVHPSTWISILPEEDPQNAQEEERSFIKVVASFGQYGAHTRALVGKRRADYESLSAAHQAQLPDYLDKLRRVDDAIKVNEHFIKHILASNAAMIQSVANSPLLRNPPRPSMEDMDKVRSTIKLFVRDWSAEGAGEREKCYLPMLNELEKLFPDKKSRRKAGYASQGNEFSFHMLFSSNFVLNSCNKVEQFKMFPFAHIFSNVTSYTQDQLACIQVPDVLPSALPQNVDFSMVAGDFVEVYSSEEYQEHFDAVLACFFLDTAHNILEYLDVIDHILRPGGALISLGPLLYHFEDSPHELSVELSWQELQHAITQRGYKLTVHPDVQTTYSTGSQQTMLKYMYQCKFFTAQKQ